MLKEISTERTNTVCLQSHEISKVEKTIMETENRRLVANAAEREEENLS